MISEFLGELCALGAALAWAFALIFFKKSGERVAPAAALNFFKNTVGLVLLGVTLLATGGGLGALDAASARDWWILAISGILGIAAADTLFFYALNLVGVGIVAIVDCCYTPWVMLFSWVLLGETLSPPQYVGIGLVLAGVLAASRHPPPVDRTRAQVVAGVVLGASAIGLMAFGIVLAKPVLERLPLIECTTVRLLAGTAVLMAYMLATPARADLWRVFQPRPVWKFSLPAAVLGSYVSLLLWIAGYKYTTAAVAAILNQMTVIFSLILATLLLGERFTRRKLVAVVLAVVGVLLVTQHARVVEWWERLRPAAT